MLFCKKGERVFVLIKIIFFGKVQNVGFRYKTREFAALIGVKGTVKNLSNGTVELVAQGSKDEINRLTEKLVHFFGKLIVDVDFQVSDAKEPFSDFRVVS